MLNANAKIDRDNSLDSITGIMVIWMVLYHVFQWVSFTTHIAYIVLLKWLFFFMPWFYFKSGILHRDNKLQPLPVKLAKLFNTLLVPLLIWMSIGFIVSFPSYLLIEKYSLTKILGSPIFKLFRWGETFGNPPLWFLCSLFIVKILSSFLFRFSGKLIFSVNLLILVVGYCLSKANILVPLGLHNVIIGMVFYYYGYLYKAKIESQKIPTIIFVCVTLLFGFVNLLYPSYVDVHINRLLYGSYWGFIINSMLILILLVPFMKNINLGFLSWVGRHSMSVLVLHSPLLVVIKTGLFIFNINLSYSELLFLYCALLILSFALLLRILPHSFIIGKHFYIQNE